MVPARALARSSWPATPFPFVLPSHQENFGIAVAEALACGLPVLISDKINIWREISEDGAGFVAEDTEAGTAYLLRAWLALTAEETRRMRKRARCCFLTRFEIEAAAESLVETLMAHLEDRNHQEQPAPQPRRYSSSAQLQNV